MLTGDPNGERPNDTAAQMLGFSPPAIAQGNPVLDLPGPYRTLANDLAIHDQRMCEVPGLVVGALDRIDGAALPLNALVQ